MCRESTVAKKKKQTVEKNLKEYRGDFPPPCWPLLEIPILISVVVKYYEAHKC